MRDTLLNIRNQFKRAFGRDNDDDDFEFSNAEDYVEVGPENEFHSQQSAKITVRPYTIEDFEDIKDILKDLREGRTIALINMSLLKEKDIVELKRAINKLKKTCDAIDGDIAGFGDNYIVATPEFARVHRIAKDFDDSEIEH